MPTITAVRLAELREQRGLTHQSLADKVGVSRQSIGAFEKGAAKPSIETLVSLAEALETSTDYLLGKEPVASPSPYPMETAKHRFIPLDNFTLLELPFLPIHGRASFVDSFLNDSSYEPMSSVQVLLTHQEARDYKDPIVIEVDGDSMEPQLQTRMQVLVTPVNEADYKYATGVHVVLYRDSLAIKRIKTNNLEADGFVVLHSDSPTGGTMRVLGEDIRQMWKVRKIVGGPIN